jgi:Ca2+-binding EF-hand superfamily protein
MVVKFIVYFIGMKEVFDTYDTKNQGFIKTSLLGKILRTLGLNPLESDIQRIAKEIDPQSNFKILSNR